jgi:secondary thiamine-phosphate synthase enzyme
MPPLRHDLTLETSAPIEILDLTDAVRAWVQASGVRDGLLTVLSPHTTARITLNERDPALQRDMVTFLERVAPREEHYEHNLHTVDDRANAHAHLLGLFMPASVSVPVVGGDLELGGWQSLFFVELDGPRRTRTVQLHLVVSA